MPRIERYSYETKEGSAMTERSEQERTRDIFAHIHEILERDGDKAEILFNAIQLRMLLKCEPTRAIAKTRSDGMDYAIKKYDGSAAQRLAFNHGVKWALSDDND